MFSNLCGEPFLDCGLFKFTDDHKRRVEQSRIGTADTLNQYVKSDDSIKRFVQITGVGAYPYQPMDVVEDRKSFGGIPKPFTEESDASSRKTTFEDQGFKTEGKYKPTDYGAGHYFHNLVHDWEAAAHGDKTTVIRSGVVLGKDGGALQTGPSLLFGFSDFRKGQNAKKRKNPRTLSPRAPLRPSRTLPRRPK